MTTPESDLEKSFRQGVLVAARKDQEALAPLNAVLDSLLSADLGDLTTALKEGVERFRAMVKPVVMQANSEAVAVQAQQALVLGITETAADLGRVLKDIVRSDSRSEERRVGKECRC